MRAPGRACSFGYSLLRPGLQFGPFNQTPFAFSLQGEHLRFPVARPLPLPLPPARGFISSPSLALRLPSPTRNIQDSLRRLKHDKWGWVIYRCTYSDDEAWTRFKQIISQRSREFIADYDTPDAADSLEWTFVEDRGALNGASRDQLRAHFKNWTTEAVRAEQPRAEDVGIFGIPRYNFFIQVDQSALESVAYDAPQTPEIDVHDEGHVKVVDANWKPLSQRFPAEGGEGDEPHEPIDGCREENVGWMKIAASMVGPDFYDALSRFPDVWYFFYQRPPTTVTY